MNPKYSIFYLFLLPGIIFSLISIFSGFSWTVLILSFLIGMILYIKESGILLQTLNQTTENTTATSASANSVINNLKKTSWTTMIAVIGAIVMLAVIAMQYGPAITAFLKP